MNAVWGPVVEALDVQRRTWWRSALVLLFVLLVGLASLTAIAPAAVPMAQRIATDAAFTRHGILRVAAPAVLPLLVVVGLVSAAWLASVVTLVDRATGAQQPSITAALGTAVRRTLPVGRAWVAWVSGVVVLVLLTPLLVPAGVVVGVLRLVLPLRGVDRPSWATWSVAALLCVPLAPAVVAATRGLLVFPFVARGSGVIAGLRASSRSVGGRSVQVAASLGVAVALVILVELVATNVMDLLAPGSGVALVGTALTMLVLYSLPIAVLAVLAVRPSGPPDPAVDPARGPRPGSPRMATTVVLALLGQVVAVPALLTVGATPAYAAVSDTVTVTMTAPVSPVSSGDLRFVFEAQPDAAGPAPDVTGQMSFFFAPSGSEAPPEATLAEVSPGRWEFDLTGVAPGLYDAFVYYRGDGVHYTPTFSPRFPLEVTAQQAAGLRLTVDPTQSDFGDAVTLTATVTGPSVGDVIFGVEGTFASLGTAPLVDGVATLTVDDLAPGTSTVTAGIPSQVGWSGATDAVSDVQVSALETATGVSTSPASPTLVGEAVEVLVEVATVTGDVAASGTAQLTQRRGLAVQTTTVPIVDGVGRLTLTDLAAGTHAFSASFVPDLGFLSSGTAVDVEHDVRRSSTTTTIEAVPATAVTGQAVTLTASVTSSGPIAPTGLVTFHDGGVPLGSVSVDVATGTAALDVATLAPGTRSLTATYVGDAATEASPPSDPALVTVGAAATSVTVTPSAGSVDVGASFTAEVAVVPVAPGQGVPAGSVEVIDDGVRLAGPVPLTPGSDDGSATATVTLVAGAAGARTLTARFVPDDPDVFSASTGTTQITSVTTPTSVTVTPSTGSVDVGATFTALVEVAPVAPGQRVPVGAVEVIDDGVRIAGPVPLTPAAGGASATATVALVAGAAGTRTLTARFVPDDPGAFLGSSGTGSVESVRTPTRTILWGPGSPRTYGQEAHFDAIVTASRPVSGSVRFVTSGGVDLGTLPLGPDGRVRLSVSTLDAGPRQVVAIFEANDRFATSLDAAPLEVLPAAVTATLQVSPDAPLAGEAVTLTATLTSPGAVAPSGEVVFRDSTFGPLGDATLVDGVAKLDTTLRGGTSTIEASYVGDRRHDPKVVALPVVVARQTPSVRILQGNVDLVYGNQLDVEVVVSGQVPGYTPTGSIRFDAASLGSQGYRLDGGRAVASFCLGGAPSCAGVPSLPVGPATFGAQYLGGIDVLAGDAPAVDIDILEAPTVTGITTSDANAAVGQVVVYTATVAAPSSSAAPVGSVAFLAVDGTGGAVRIGVEPVVDGIARIGVPAGSTLPVDVSRVEARYVPAAVGTFEPSTGTVEQAIAKIPTSLSISTGQLARVGEALTVEARFIGVDTTELRGAVVFRMSDGQSCRVEIGWWTRPSCSITPALAGPLTVTAAFSGDARHAPSRATSAISVAKGRPRIVTSVTPRGEPDRRLTWVTDEPIKVSYAVLGPASGPARVGVPGGAWCEGLPLVGDCSITFDGDRYSTGRTPLFVEFPGNDDWERAVADLTGHLTVCRQLTFVADPSDGGTVAPRSGGNCNDGDGYLDGTVVEVGAAPIAPYLFDGWAAGGTDTLLRLVVGPNATGAAALFSRPCEQLTLTVSRVFYGELRVDTPPNCTDPRYRALALPLRTDDGSFTAGRGTESVTGWYRRGTVVDVTAVGGRFPFQSPFQLYSLTGVPWAGERTVSVRVDAPVDLTAVFGRACSHLELGPGIAATSPPDCVTADGPGWREGTVVTFERSLARGMIVDSWFVDSQRLSQTAPVVRWTADGEDHRVATNLRSCRQIRLTVEKNGWSGDVALNSDPADRCGELGDDWYSPAVGRITLTTSDDDVWPMWHLSRGSLWAPQPSPRDGRVTRFTRQVALANGDADVEVTLVHRGFCHPLRVRAHDRMAGRAATVSSTQDTNGCQDGDIDGRYPVELTAVPTLGDPTIGWAARTGTGADAPSMRRLTADGRTVAVRPFGRTYTSFEVFYCQTLDLSGELILDDGTRVPLVGGLVPPFLTVQGDQRCPGWSNDVFVAGSTVTVGAKNDGFFPAVGWQGDHARRAGGSLAFTVGDEQPSVRVRGIVEVQCVDVRVDSGLVSRDDPTCIGSAAGAPRFLAGTDVKLVATLETSDYGFRGFFEGGVAVPGDWRVTLTADRDRSIHASYHEKSDTQKLGEWIQQAAEDVGDALAVLGKKVIGAAAVVLGEIVMGLPPLGVAIQGLGAVAAGLDYVLGLMGVEDALFSQVMTGIQETAAMVTAGTRCLGAWGLGTSTASTGGSAGGGGATAVPQEDITVLAARALMGSPDRGVIELELPDGTRTNDPEVVRQLETMISEQVVDAFESDSSSEYHSDGWDELVSALATVAGGEEAGVAFDILSIIKKLDSLEVKLPSGMRLRTVKEPAFTTHVTGPAKLQVVNKFKTTVHAISGGRYGTSVSDITTVRTAQTSLERARFANRVKSAGPAAVISLGSLLYEMGDAGTLGWDASAADAFGAEGGRALDSCMAAAGPTWMVNAMNGA